MVSPSALLVEPRWDRRLEATARGDLTAMLRSIDGGVTYQHGLRVGGLAVAMARILGVDPPGAVFEAGLYHDIGKIAVPESILSHPDELDDEERAVMEIHVEEGERLLNATGKAYLVPLVGQHHERLDGLGYPRGLRAEEISLLSQVIAAADIYDALTAQRSYRPTISRYRALDTMRGLVGTHFSPQVMALLDEVVRSPEQVEPLSRVAAALALRAGEAEEVS